MYLFYKSKPFWISLLAVFLAVFTLNNFVGKDQTSIISDGKGYYDFLPSIFIYNDLNRKDSSLSKGDKVFDRFNDPYIFVKYKDVLLNKYPIGTAILQFPFFYATYHLVADKYENVTGYEVEFHKAIQIASYFYLFLGLWFLSHLLLSYGLNHLTLLVLIPFVPISTNILHYINSEAAFSHVYSFFAISAFCYFTRKLMHENKLKNLLYASIFFGIIIILRQINLIVLFALPLLAGSKDNLLNSIKFVFSKPKNIIALVLPSVLLLLPQILVWYYQTGDYIIYSYQGEGFNFLHPAFFEILFSYRKGLFIYTPVLFLGVIGIFYLLFQKKRLFFAYSWLGFFLLLTYILSSWHSWWYGCSFGQRAYIDFFPILLIPIGLLIYELKSKPLKIVTILISLMCIPVNVIQANQYKNYILHWLDMDKEMYWKIFLKSDKIYRGLVWKIYDENVSMAQIKEWNFPSIEVEESNSFIFEQQLPIVSEQSTIQMIEIEFEHEFEERNKTTIEVSIQSETSGEYYYIDSRPLLHYSTESLNGKQKGRYQYMIDLPSQLSDTLNIRVKRDPINSTLLLNNFSLMLLGKSIDMEKVAFMMQHIQNDPKWFSIIQKEAERKELNVEEVLRSHAIWAIENP